MGGPIRVPHRLRLRAVHRRPGPHGGAEALGVTVVPASGGNTALQAQLPADLGARGFCCTPSFALGLGEAAIESVLMADARMAGHYAIVVDRRPVMADLTVHCELASEDHLPARHDIRDRLERALHSTLRSRIGVDLGRPGTVPRPEGGKAQRVFERTGDAHPLGRT